MNMNTKKPVSSTRHKGAAKNNITDMTVGSPVKHILSFAAPLLIGNIFQQFYNMVDSIIVGNYVRETDFCKRPLAKMMHDIAKELGLI